MTLWSLAVLGLIDIVAGGILFFNEGVVKFIGLILLGKGMVTLFKSFFEW